MSKFRMSASVAAACLLVAASFSFAAEKKEGLMEKARLAIIQKMAQWKASREKTKAPVKKAPVKKAPVKKAPPQKPVKAVKDMTKDELIKEMKSILASENEILGRIPGLKAEKDANGEEFYTYQGVRLEAVDRGQLEKIYSRIRSEALRIRTDRINRQLETIKRTQRIATPPPALPPSGAKIPPTPPTTPRIPKSPPKAPPLPPRR